MDKLEGLKQLIYKGKVIEDFYINKEGKIYKKSIHYTEFNQKTEEEEGYLRVFYDNKKIRIKREWAINENFNSHKLDSYVKARDKNGDHYENIYINSGGVVIDSRTMRERTIYDNKRLKIKGKWVYLKDLMENSFNGE